MRSRIGLLVLAWLAPSGGAGRLQFTLAGAPSTDKGLTFARVK
jgi:hypothetical protein